ncbi:MAG: hypothetical protein IJV22_00950 [Bacteroidales bacterium]|nr:hypothetical protein [Bacteroidales bacterium]
MKHPKTYSFPSAVRALTLFLIAWTIGEMAFAQFGQTPSAATATRSTTTRSNTSQSTNSTSSSAFGGSDTTMRDTTAVQGIVWNNKEVPDSILASQVHMFHYEPREVKLHTIMHPKIDPTGVELCNPIDLNMDYILSAGLGRTNLSLWAQPEQILTFRFAPNVYGSLLHTPNAATLYQTQHPYTLLSYNSSIHKDYRLRVLHTQNIQPRLNMAFNADVIKTDGVYTNSATSDKSFEITTNYYSADSRYQVQAAFIRNNLMQQENGGVVDDEECWSTTPRSGVPVRYYAANNRYRTSTLFIHQSYNTVRQVEQLHQRHRITKRDSLTTPCDTCYHAQPRVITLQDTTYLVDTLPVGSHRIVNSGVWGLDVQLDKFKRNYYDPQIDPYLYPNTFYDSTATLDSTTLLQAQVSVYWTNDAFLSHRWSNPFIFTVGLQPRLVSVPTWQNLSTADWNTPTMREQRTTLTSLNPYVYTRLRLGEHAIMANAEYSVGGYTMGNYLFQLSGRIATSKQSEWLTTFSTIDHEPDYIFSQFASNNHRWIHSDLKAIHTDLLSTQYVWQAADSLPSSLRHINITINAYRQRHIVQIENDLLPHQINDPVGIAQAVVDLQWSWLWLRFHMVHILQYSTVPAIVELPLFATRNSLYADFHLFKRALHVQTGIDLKYHTAYHPDAWSPSLGLFYAQDDTSIGNHLWTDFFVALQIKRASIYIKVTHLNAPLDSSPHYFILPHTPGEDLGVYWGLTWQFFN